MDEKKEEKEIEKSVDSAIIESKQPIGIGIVGLEEVPPSIIPVPYVRLVQPTSQKIGMVSGKDAPVGTFYFNDTQRVEETLSFVILKAKHGPVTYERDGEIVDTTKLAILGYDLVGLKLFILSLSVMSFANFGKLVAQLKEKTTKEIWEYEIIATAEKQENEKGKYYVAKFEIGNQIDEEKREVLKNLYRAYGKVLERQDSEAKEEKGEEIPF